MRHEFRGAGIRKRKGYDIGYALAANSCEGVNSVEACTVIAPDAITAFTVPNPNGNLAAPSVFSGLAADELPRRADHPVYFGLTTWCEVSLSTVDANEAKCRVNCCQCPLLVQLWKSTADFHIQLSESLLACGAKRSPAKMLREHTRRCTLTRHFAS